MAAPVLREEGDVFSVQRNRTFIHIESAGNGIEQGGLASTVGTDNGGKVSGIQMKGQAGNGGFGIDGSEVKGFGNMFQVQHFNCLLSGQQLSVFQTESSF